MKLKIFIGTVVALAAPSVASAVPPSITTVGHQDRHPVATFSAPRAANVTIYFASKPDRATDGSFLTENVEHSGFLTDSEIQASRWLDSSQIEPGRYWVMLLARPNFDSCYIYDTGGYDPACADGYSQLVEFVVPEPIVRYSVTVTLYRGLGSADLRLRANPLGVDRAYRLCWRNARKLRRCLSGNLDGYSWNEAATDDLSVTLRGLAKFTTFQWFVGSRLVVQRRVRVR